MAWSCVYLGASWTTIVFMERLSWRSIWRTGRGVTGRSIRRSKGAMSLASGRELAERCGSMQTTIKVSRTKDNSSRSVLSMAKWAYLGAGKKNLLLIDSKAILKDGAFLSNDAFAA